MFTWLFAQLTPLHGFFGVAQFSTFRAVAAGISALLLMLLFGGPGIRWLRKQQIGEVIRHNGPQTHHSKTGTPTMGGVLMIGTVIVSTLAWAELHSRYIWYVLAVIVLFAAIGFYDDSRKLLGHRRGVAKRGVSVRHKFLAQSAAAVAVVAVIYMTAQTPAETILIVPFFKTIALPLGLLFIVVGWLLITGMSNAVNLTDGLDGLAVMPVALVGGALAAFAYVSGHAEFAPYLGMPYLPGVGELVVACAAVSGACLGFLWFNAHPAEVFMGDTGALPLGAFLGATALLVRQEIVLLVMGGLFVAEALSVMAQVGSYRWRGKRVLLMAPLHHHFEQKGWPETKVVIRFWIVTVLLVLVGLATLKIR